MNRLAAILVRCAAVATTYATITYLTDMAIDFEISALTATACLLAVTTLKLADRARRRRRAAARAAVWRRREREAYGAPVPDYPDSIPLDGKPYRHLAVIDGATVCIPKIAPALSTRDVDNIRAAIRSARTGQRHV